MLLRFSSRSQPIETTKREQFKADAPSRLLMTMMLKWKMERFPHLKKLSEVGELFREAQKRRDKMLRRLLMMPSVARPSSLARWVRVVALFGNKRSPRRSKKSAFSMSSANTTSWGSCRMFVSSSLSDVLFVQEAKVTAEMLPDVQNALQRNGWRGAFSAAISKSRFGASGGVAVLARSHLGSCSMRYGENFAWNRGGTRTCGRGVFAWIWWHRVVLCVLARWRRPRERNLVNPAPHWRKDSCASVAGDCCW